VSWEAQRRGGSGKGGFKVASRFPSLSSFGAPTQRTGGEDEDTSRCQDFRPEIRSLPPIPHVGNQCFSVSSLVFGPGQHGNGAREKKKREGGAGIALCMWDVGDGEAEQVGIYG